MNKKIKDYEEYPKLYEHLLKQQVNDRGKSDPHKNIQFAFTWMNAFLDMSFYQCLHEGKIKEAKAMHPELFEKNMESEFKKGDYIVILNGITASSNNSFIANHVYKLREDCDYLRPEKDSKGGTSNGWSHIHYNEKDRWRYAGASEIYEYDKLDKPCSSKNAKAKFQEGDVVRCIEGVRKGAGWMLGKTFTVNHVNKGTYSFVCFPEIGSGVYENSLELVPKELDEPRVDHVPKVGDYVEITKSDQNWNQKMDKYIGRVVQITRVDFDDCIHFEGCGSWAWNYNQGHFTFYKSGELEESTEPEFDWDAIVREGPESFNLCEEIKLEEEQGTFMKPVVFKSKSKKRKIIV